MPPPRRSIETWKSFIDIRKAGYARAIGVSNWEVRDLQQVSSVSAGRAAGDAHRRRALVQPSPASYQAYEATGEYPAVNQIENHPYWQTDGEEASARRRRRGGVGEEASAGGCMKRAPRESARLVWSHPCWPSALGRISPSSQDIIKFCNDHNITVTGVPSAVAMCPVCSLPQNVADPGSSSLPSVRADGRLPAVQDAGRPGAQGGRQGAQRLARPGA